MHKSFPIKLLELPVSQCRCGRTDVVLMEYNSSPIGKRMPLWVMASFRRSNC
uniref:Uncharacterized protein n=1 Tax=Lepeophtheirus salmonis TaxID=72036 RepID=A0A0K2T5I8_LEPSM